MTVLDVQKVTATTSQKRRRRKDRRNRAPKPDLRKTLIRYRWLFVLMLPGIIYFLAFRFYPMYGAQIAFRNYVPFLGIEGTDVSAEMAERVAKLIGPKLAEKVYMSTFHSLGYDILRQDIDALGYKKPFTILDTADQLRIVQDVYA